ncbi:unnamed protein product [Phytophthora lilii]|uniref:Unnamed protein product n=1 Tax=Phytophthora lilii TaxID=2077276 RepID=A0A9W6XA27_9STRA|nr:unnamed protein product [Phytophthora lilii]
MDSIQRAQESAMDDIDQLRHLNETKADTLELVQVRHNMVNQFACAVVDEKMTVSDVKELVNSQTTLKGLQGAIEKVESAAAGEFVTKSEFENTHRQVQAISRQLRSEIYQARYVSTCFVVFGDSVT